MLYQNPNERYPHDSTQHELPLGDVPTQNEFAFTEAESNPKLSQDLRQAKKPSYEEEVLADPTNFG